MPNLLLGVPCTMAGLDGEARSHHRYYFYSLFHMFMCSSIVLSSKFQKIGTFAPASIPAIRGEQFCSTRWSQDRQLNLYARFPVSASTNVIACGVSDCSVSHSGQRTLMVDIVLLSFAKR